MTPGKRLYGRTVERVVCDAGPSATLAPGSFDPTCHITRDDAGRESANGAMAGGRVGSSVAGRLADASIESTNRRTR